MKAGKIIPLILFLFLLSGCASSRLYFKPIDVVGPIYAEDVDSLFIRVPLVPALPGQEEAAKKKPSFGKGEILVSTNGIFLEAAGRIEGPVLQIRLLFDNTGNNRLTFQGERSRIIENRFRVFEVTSVYGAEDEPDPGMEIAPGESRTFNLYFRFPSTYDPERLERFVFKWYYLLNEEEVEGIAEFNRVYYFSSYPWWGPVWYPWFCYNSFYFSSGVCW